MNKIEKGTIIVDLDCTLVRTKPLWVGYLNERYRINTTISDLENTSLEDLVNKKTGLCLTFDEFYLEFTEHFTKSIRWHRDIQLLPFVKEVIPEISKKYNLFISTSRNSLGREVINYILDKHDITRYFNGIHFEYSFKEKNVFMKYSKSNFISSFDGKASYFIDDSESQIEQAKNVVISILLDPTFTKKIEGSWSLPNWLEIANLVIN